MTSLGIPLDEPIAIRVRDVLLRVPAGYLWPWPSLDARSRVNEQATVGVEFWMPERRYLEVNPMSVIGFRTEEPGRSEPPSGAYLVRVNGLQPVALDSPGYLSPERRFQNLTSTAGLSSYSFKEEPFGLVRFWRHDWPHPSPEPFADYRNKEGTDPQVLLHCTPSHSQLPNPSCQGNVHFVADGLGFFFFFPREALPEWREIVRAVRELFNSWKESR